MMRVVGWLLTGLGCGGLFVAVGLIAMAATRKLANPDQGLVASLCTAALFGTLILLGRRCQIRSKPLLPIHLAS